MLVVGMCGPGVPAVVGGFDGVLNTVDRITSL